VVVREDIDKRLVAYVVGSANAAELRDALARVLPEYMVPSAFVFLDALPLSPNGKLERRALPAPDAAVSTQEYEAPRNEFEEILVSLFAEILHVPRAGIHDSFFALGGHSLTATQLVTRVRAHFEVDLPVRAVFENPTVVALAGKIEDLVLDQIEQLSAADASTLLDS